jgi:glycosyltransferase involved in cell wall biosynthesis
MHVTVVMPAYNAVATVSAAIESIRKQTYTHWDLLIVDDGSTDGTWEVLKSAAFLDPRIALIRNPSNRGLAASLNTGWRQAGGEVIARMDADDTSLPQRFEKQIDRKSVV